MVEISRINELSAFKGPGDAVTRILMSRAAGDDSASIIYLVFPPGGRSDTHTRSSGEYIHIIDGESEIFVEGEKHWLATGDTMFIPEGLEHYHVNVGQTDLRQVVIFVPSGPEMALSSQFEKI